VIPALYLGNPTATVTELLPAGLTGAMAGEAFGNMTVDDLDGDGFCDIAVCSAYHNGYRGRVLVFRGQPTGVDPVARYLVSGSAVGEYLGSWPATPSDIDGDGFNEFTASFLLGSPRASLRVFRGGLAGPFSGPSWVVSAPGGVDSTSYSIAVANR